MAFPGDVNSLGSVSGSQTLAAAGHATRHNEVKTALEGLRDVLGGTAVPSGTVQPILAAGSASAPSLSFTGDSNTGLWSPAADTVAASTGGTERMRIDNAGNVGIGTTSPDLPLTVASTVASILAADRYQAGTGQPGMFLRKSRNATVGSQTIVQSGDGLGGIFFAGSDGSAFSTGAGITAVVSGTPGASDVPAYLSFNTKATGVAYSEKMRLDGAGLITGTGTSLGAWTAFTPTLTASTTNPTLGTGSTASGYYIQIGKMVVVRIGLQFGTSGAAAGTGTYTIGALPVSAATSGAGTTRQVGPIMLYDASANVVWTGGQAEMSGTTLTNIYYGNGTTLTAVGAAAPWTWAASDQIRLSFVYEAA